MGSIEKDLLPVRMTNHGRNPLLRSEPAGTGSAQGEGVQTPRMPCPGNPLPPTKRNRSQGGYGKGSWEQWSITTSRCCKRNDELMMMAMVMRMKERRKRGWLSVLKMIVFKISLSNLCNQVVLESNQSTTKNNLILCHRLLEGIQTLSFLWIDCFVANLFPRWYVWGSLLGPCA